MTQAENPYRQDVFSMNCGTGRTVSRSASGLNTRCKSRSCRAVPHTLFPVLDIGCGPMRLGSVPILLKGGWYYTGRESRHDRLW